MMNLIVARDSMGGIAKEGKIPWMEDLATRKIPNEDSKFFRELTMGNIVIMGRKTYDSLPTSAKPLKGRINIVIGRSYAMQIETNLNDEKKSTNCGTELYKFFDPWHAAKFAASYNKPIFVIGGSQIYEWYEKYNFISKLYITELMDDYRCDQFFISKFNSTDDYTQHIVKYIENPKGVIVCRTICNVEESALLTCMRAALESTNLHETRNGITSSIFAEKLTFDLSNYKFPLMTTKRLNLRLIMEELMFFLRGQTDNKILQAKGVHIWDANTSKEFLAKAGLPYEEGDMGHTYGFSWRHFGAQYINCRADYTGQGFDQLVNLVENLMRDPFSRRHVISLWEPNAICAAALPPCLYNYQFDVERVKSQSLNQNHTLVLNCLATQRSSDHFTAGGWNVASAALLTILLADYCDMVPGTLSWVAGNIHIYENLKEQVNIQLEREPYLFPKLQVRPKNGKPTFITDYTYNDIELIGYVAHPSIKGIINA